MNDFNNKHYKDEIPEEEKSPSKTYFWVAVAACALGAVMFGLVFVPAIGQYGAITSMICQLIALTFLNIQKKNCKYFTACKVVRVISYVIFIAGLLYIGALALASYNATQK